MAEGNLKEAHYYWTENLPEMPPGLPYYSFDRKQADEILDKQYHRGTALTGKKTESVYNFLWGILQEIIIRGIWPYTERYVR